MIRSVLAFVVVTACNPAYAEVFDGAVPENVCWMENQAFSIGAFHPRITSQYRNDLRADQNYGYGLFCVMQDGIPVWAYFDYSVEQERWLATHPPLTLD